jgi:hypothetical protein
MRPSYKHTSRLDKWHSLRNAGDSWRDDWLEELKNLILILEVIPISEWDEDNIEFFQELTSLREAYYLGLEATDERFRREVLVWLYYIEGIQGEKKQQQTIPYETVDFSTLNQVPESKPRIEQLL